MTNYTRKFHLHPRTFDFIDFPNTKHNRPHTNEPKTPHIHSIFLIHPITQSKFETMMSEEFQEIVTHRDMRSVIPVLCRTHYRHKRRYDSCCFICVKVLTEAFCDIIAQRCLTDEPISHHQRRPCDEKHQKRTDSSWYSQRDTDCITECVFFAFCREK